MTEPATRFAVLTPPGAAAIATIAVIGPQAWDLVTRSFRSASGRSSPSQQDFHHFEYGQFGGPPGDAVVIAARPAAVGDCVEIHCHGGLEVVRMITGELTKLGATHGDVADLSRPSDLASMARMELARAPTLRTAGILLDQWSGAFARSINAIAAALAAGDFTIAAKLIDQLAMLCRLGRHLTRPWRVAVAGAPNVGKSSLVNALAGFQRSVVTETPGTTRDVVIASLAIDGWPVELIDTAGQRGAADPLEEQGIGRGRSAVAAADLCLWVVDGTVEPIWPDGDTGDLVRVINKSDLPAAWDIGRVSNAAVISARTGFGLVDLCERISRRLVPHAPPAGAAVPFTPNIADTVDAMAKAIAAGEIIAVRRAIAALVASVQSTLTV